METAIIAFVITGTILAYILRSRENKAATPAPDSDIALLRGNGEFALEVVGESFHQAALESICGPRTEESVYQQHTASLILENDNPKDKNAVRIEIQGKTVGYLSRDVAKRYREQIKKGGMPGATGECQAVIKGGWQRGENIGAYGVWLDIPVN